MWQRRIERTKENMQKLNLIRRLISMITKDQTSKNIGVQNLVKKCRNVDFPCPDSSFSSTWISLISEFN